MIKKYATTIGFILGILLGILLPNVAISLGFIGDIYIRLLKIMIVPILFFGITCAFSEGGNLKSTAKIIALFSIMFVASYLIIFDLSSIIEPGRSFVFSQVEWNGQLANLSFADFVLNIFPTNIIDAASNNSILPVILFAAILGYCIKKTNSNKTKELFEEINNINKKILEYIICLMPFGVCSLIAKTIASANFAMLKSALVYIVCAWVGCVIVCAVVMITPVWAIAGINPIQYIKKVSPVWATTISTCSSAATLPETIRVCNKNFGIPESVTNIVVPLGCTIHMCGGAVSFALLATFNMQMFGMAWSLEGFIIALVCALLINMGAPGIPGGGIIIGATYLTILGIPLDFIGFYAGIYSFLDMAYTTMNVTGDITANIIIDKWRK